MGVTAAEAGAASSHRVRPGLSRPDTKPQGAAWFSFLSIPGTGSHLGQTASLDGKVTLDEFLDTASTPASTNWTRTTPAI